MRKLVVVLSLCGLALTGCASSAGGPTLDEAKIEPAPNMVFADISYWSTPSKYADCDVRSEDLVIDEQGKVWIYKLAPVCQQLGRHSFKVNMTYTSVDLYGKDIDDIKRVDSADASRYVALDAIEILGDVK